MRAMKNSPTALSASWLAPGAALDSFTDLPRRIRCSVLRSKLAVYRGRAVVA